MKKADTTGDELTPTQRISNLIAEAGDWRGKLLTQLRKAILAAAPDIAEDWKWGTAVWTHKGLLCSAAIFKDHVKLHFFKGAALKDEHGLFNAGLDAKAMRAIDFTAGDKINAPALKDLVREAVAANVSGGKK